MVPSGSPSKPSKLKPTSPSRRRPVNLCAVAPLLLLADPGGLPPVSADADFGDWLMALWAVALIATWAVSRYRRTEAAAGKAAPPDPPEHAGSST